jgi:hypothetical protein
VLSAPGATSTPLSDGAWHAQDRNASERSSVGAVPRASLGSAWPPLVDPILVGAGVEEMHDAKATSGPLTIPAPWAGRTFFVERATVEQSERREIGCGGNLSRRHHRPMLGCLAAGITETHPSAA